MTDDFELDWSTRPHTCLWTAIAGKVRYPRTSHIGIHGPYEVVIIECERGWAVDIYPEPQRPADPDGTIYGRHVVGTFLSQFKGGAQHLATLVVAGHMSRKPEGT